MRRMQFAAAVVYTAACLVVPEPAPAQVIDSTRALAGLRDLAAACAADAGALWGAPLCGPLAIVDRGTRLVIANDTAHGRPVLPYADAWVSVLPAGVLIANTSFTWGERPWAMVPMPLPADRFARLMLLAHEGFHRDQPALGLAGRDLLNAHLDEADGRIWLRMELRALAAALEREGAGYEAHARDALLFRAQRQALFPGVDSLEYALERAEGLAEYTGAKLALLVTGEGEERVARHVRGVESRPSYARGFAYGTGPALGLLLDRTGSSWRDEARRGGEPAMLLASALRFSPPAQLRTAAERRAAAYDLAAVRAEEEERAAARAARIAAFRAALVDGEVLTLCHQSLMRAFDPNALVPLGDAGTVYPTGTFSAPWGRLQVDSVGALVSPDNLCVSVAAPAGFVAPASQDTPIDGRGWRLTLATGWRIVPQPRGFVVAAVE